MPLLSQALSVHKVERQDLGDKESLWSGVIDLEWTVVLVPNGGYVIGLILESCTAHQKLHSPKVTEPVHISAHFLRPVQGVVPSKDSGSRTLKQPATFEVHVKSVKGGSSLNNLQAELVQNGQTMVSAHLIFGVSLPAAETEIAQPVDSKALVPPSPYARRTPLRTHPSNSSEIRLYDVWNFKDRITGKEDPVFQHLNKAENRVFDKDGSVQREPPGIEFGAWLTFKDEVGSLRPGMLPFCTDIIKPLPELLPREENPLVGKTWYATLTLSIEFKAPVRIDTQTGSTLGLYSVGRFLQDPLGRHETIVEVWTAPSGEASEPDDGSWREKQRCLATAVQTALCIPYEQQSKGMKSRV
ncbi:hypothetical protein ACEPAH_4004 [Sanghuangporus vaninii]